MSELLRVRDLNVYFSTSRGEVKANNGVNLEIAEGVSTGVMGESGCGKTVLLLSILHLQQPGRIVKGSVELAGKDITTLEEQDMQDIRGRQIALIPQNQATALNPAYTVKEQLIETINIRRRGGSLWSTLSRYFGRPDIDAVNEIEAVFREIGFDSSIMIERLLHSYPHQLSGGIRQRVLIAMALLLQPRLIIADEPTTALDYATKAISLRLLQQLRSRITMLVVSHDIETIKSTCDYVAVMYGGRIVERGNADEVLGNPRHPYTRMLLSCQQRRRGDSLVVMDTDTLDMINFPSGCSFHPACPYAMPECAGVYPAEIDSGGVTVACHLYNREAGSCWKSIS